MRDAGCCRRCKSEEWDDRYSFGVYAGRWCDKCWPESGYRDAADPDAVWSPMDAGEVMEPDDY